MQIVHRYSTLVDVLIMPTCIVLKLYVAIIQQLFLNKNNDTMPKPGNKQLQKRRNDKYKNNKIIIYPL